MTTTETIPLPEDQLLDVYEVGKNVWMVSSESTGAYWPVRRVIVDGTPLLDCPCPAGRVNSGRPVDTRNACRHQRLVLRFVQYRFDTKED